MRILLVLLILISTTGFSQISPSPAQDYHTYHQLINKAEQLISNEDFQKAMLIYNGIFKSYDFVFVKDYKIAAQLAFYSDDKENTIKLIEKGFAAGWTLKELKKNKYLKKLNDEADWNTIVDNYPKHRKIYLDKIDQATRDKVLKMYKLDQRKALGALFRLGQKAKEKYANNKFAPHSERQINKLIKILEKKGYPGEQLVGNNYWMSTILSHHNSISRTQVNNDTLYNFIKPKLKKAIAIGQMSPFEFAIIDDWQIAVSSGRKQTGYGFLNLPRKSTLEETNKLRAEISLRSIELRNRLVDIERKTGMNFYLPDWVDGKIVARAD